MERKSITNAAKFIVELWNAGAFAVVWLLFYNDYTFDKYWQLGAFITLLLYFVLYPHLYNLPFFFLLVKCNYIL